MSRDYKPAPPCPREIKRAQADIARIKKQVAAELVALEHLLVEDADRRANDSWRHFNQQLPVFEIRGARFR